MKEKILVPNVEAGGTRTDELTTSDHHCDTEKCEKSISTFWVDHTVFIPFPSADNFGKGEEEDGVCELRSDLFESISCTPKFGRMPLDCRSSYRRVGSTVIAVQYVTSEIRCRKPYFKPFHRTQKVDTIKVNDDQKFSKNYPDVGVPVSQGFVQNFRLRDMSITGPRWMSLVDGWLTGAPPKVASKTVFDFQVTATNSNGSESVEITIEVSPT